jgi:hypothetical protein
MSRNQEPSLVYLEGEHVIDAAPTARAPIGRRLLERKRVETNASDR